MDDAWGTIKLSGREVEIAKALIEATAAALRQRDARLAKLEARTLADSFKGSWLPGTYEKGALVQRGNGVWLCMSATSEQPGHSPSWRLLAGGR